MNLEWLIRLLLGELASDDHSPITYSLGLGRVGEVSEWIKLPAIEGRTACYTCGCGSHDILEMDRLLVVGFGDVSVKKNGLTVWSEMDAMHESERENKDPTLWEAKDAEKIAKDDPDNDWRIHFLAPMYEAEYQRQGEAHWVLISRGEGFA